MSHSLVVPGVGSCAASVACESLVVRGGEVVAKALEVLVVGKTQSSQVHRSPATQHHESKSQDSHFARSSVLCQTHPPCAVFCGTFLFTALPSLVESETSLPVAVRILSKPYEKVIYTKRGEQ